MARRPKLEPRTAAQLKSAHGKVLQMTGQAKKDSAMLTDLLARQAQGRRRPKRAAKPAAAPRPGGITMGGGE